MKYTAPELVIIRFSAAEVLAQSQSDKKDGWESDIVWY